MWMENENQRRLGVKFFGALVSETSELYVGLHVALQAQHSLRWYYPQVAILGVLEFLTGRSAP